MAKKDMLVKTCAAVLILIGCVTMEVIAQPPSLEKPGQSKYTDKNNHFAFSPPQGWERKEFNDPRTKVEFYVPLAGAGNMREASLFFLSQDIKAAYPSGELDIFKESENRVSRLRSGGARDAQFTKIEFCGVDTSLIEATLPQQQIKIYALMFLKYDRIYTISFTTSSSSITYDENFPIVKTALDTFQCTAPEGSEPVETSQEDIDRIQAERIRVQINALNYPDMGDDAEATLIARGAAAVPALLEIEKNGTPVQKLRAKRILGKTAKNVVTAIAQLRYGLTSDAKLVLMAYYESDPDKVEVPKKEDGTYVMLGDTENGNRYTLYKGIKTPNGTVDVMEKITHPANKRKVKTFLVTDVAQEYITGKTEFIFQEQ